MVELQTMLGIYVSERLRLVGQKQDFMPPAAGGAKKYLSRRVAL